MLFGYLIGPFGALLASGIFTSQLQNYLTNVLKLDLGFLTTLQLLSTILIVAANLVVGQLIERTRTLAGKARPWILLSALTLSVASVLMFIVPFADRTARMVWIAIAYNAYYAVGFPIYNTANSTLVPVSTRNSKQRSTLASLTNIASLGDAWGMSQSLLAVLGAIPMAVAAVFVVPLANKFGKRLTCLVGMAIGVAGGVIAGLGGSNIIPVAIGIALKCLGSSPACYLILAMLADVIDHIEYTRGIRTDGLTMSVYSALMVAATPVCNAIFSGILNASGYDQSADVALNTLGQSATVNTAISVSYIWVETAAYALCAVLVFLWTVEKNLPAEQAAIVERKKGATQ